MRIAIILCTLLEFSFKEEEDIPLRLNFYVAASCNCLVRHSIVRNVYLESYTHGENCLTVTALSTDWIPTQVKSVHSQTRYMFLLKYCVIHHTIVIKLGIKETCFINYIVYRHAYINGFGFVVSCVALISMVMFHGCLSKITKTHMPGLQTCWMVH